MLLITGMLEAMGIIDLDKGILQRIADGMYENYGDAMKAYVMDPVGVISDPLGIGLAEKGTSSVVKGWIWLMTTGRKIPDSANQTHWKGCWRLSEGVGVGSDT